MDSKTDLKQKGNIKGSSKNSTAFDEGISVLFEEIQLAIQWNRPSILLAVHSSYTGREKAQRSLESKLSALSRDVVHFRQKDEPAGLFQVIEQRQEQAQSIYFVEGLGRDKNSYRVLNMRREEFVERSIIVVFWLSETEAMELPRFAPDFWAFRHRVIQFAPVRGSRKKALPAGILVWLAEDPFLLYEPAEERIASQEAILHELPSNDEVLLLHAEATYLLAALYWTRGDPSRAQVLLQQEMDHVSSFQAHDMVATFLNGLAIISYDQKEYDRALENLLSATELSPGNIVLWANLAVVYHAMGKSGQAVRTLKKCIKSSPHTFWLWYVLGFIYLSLRKLDLALSAFEECSQQNPENYFASFAILICLTLMGNTMEMHKRVQLPGGRFSASSKYQAVCMDALVEGEAASIGTLRSAMQDGSISSTLVARDPVLNILFGDIAVLSTV